MDTHTFQVTDYAAIAATTGTITYAAVDGINHRIHGIYWSLDADDATANFIITKAGVTVAKFYTPTKGPGFEPINGNGGTGNAVTVAFNTGAANGTLIVDHSQG